MVGRRDFLMTLRTGFVAGGMGGSDEGRVQSPRPAAGVPRTIDPNTIRRRGVGLRGYDPARTSPGSTLFAPATGGGSVYLVDIEGKVEHTWTLPYPPGLYGYLTPRGTLFYNGQIKNDTFIGQTPFMGGAVMEVDWRGKVLWELKQPDHHHDGRLLRNGNVLLLCSAPLPAGVARRVRGGLPGSEQRDGVINGEYLLERTTEGRTVWEWRAWEHMDPEQYPITSPSDTRNEWLHGNGIEELPGGDILLSFRNISTLVRINRATGSVDWSLGAPPLSGQHAPVALPNGRILLFDNGPFRVDTGAQPFSRALEIDPATKQIVWTYQDGINPGSRHFFFSSRVSNAQRLPNGNTLINEGLYGRFFEVTPDGDVVWEYVNPHFGPATSAAKGQTNNVFRVYRYTAEEIAAAQRR